MFGITLDGSNVNLFIALVAGFVTFFASCLLPLVPTYLAYLSGVSLNSEEAGTKRFEIVKVAFFFVLGFIITFVLLALSINAITAYFSPFRFIVEKLAGFIFIILGFFMFGIFKHPFFMKERKLDLRKIFSRSERFNIENMLNKYKNVHAVLTGVAFGFAWTPCIGPVLAVILYWSSLAESTLSGVLLLVAYGIGLGIPFMLVAIGFEKVIPVLKRYSRASQYVSYASGVIIIIAGVMMITGQFHSLSLMMVRVLNLEALAG